MKRYSRVVRKSRRTSKLSRPRFGAKRSAVSIGRYLPLAPDTTRLPVSFCRPLPPTFQVALSLRQYQSLTTDAGSPFKTHIVHPIIPRTIIDGLTPQYLKELLAIWSTVQVMRAEVTITYQSKDEYGATIGVGLMPKVDADSIAASELGYNRVTGTTEGRSISIKGTGRDTASVTFDVDFHKAIVYNNDASFFLKSYYDATPALTLTWPTAADLQQAPAVTTVFTSSTTNQQASVRITSEIIYHMKFSGLHDTPTWKFP